MSTNLAQVRSKPLWTDNVPSKSARAGSKPVILKLRYLFISYRKEKEKETLKVSLPWQDVTHFPGLLASEAHDVSSQGMAHKMDALHVYASLVKPHQCHAHLFTNLRRCCKICNN